MKRKFIFALLTSAVTLVSASAQNGERLIVNAGNIENVTISHDLNVVLVPTVNSHSSVSLDPSSFDKLDVKLTRNRLTISSLRYAGKEKPTVYLHVSNLRTITVENNSQVKTIGVIDSPKLDLYVDGEATVHLRSNGIIDAHALNDAELKINYLSDKSLVRR